MNINVASLIWCFLLDYIYPLTCSITALEEDYTLFLFFLPQCYIVVCHCFSLSIYINLQQIKCDTVTLSDSSSPLNSPWKLFFLFMSFSVTPMLSSHSTDASPQVSLWFLFAIQRNLNLLIEALSKKKIFAHVRCYSQRIDFMQSDTNMDT